MTTLKFKKDKNLNGVYYAKGSDTFYRIEQDICDEKGKYYLYISKTDFWSKDETRYCDKVSLATAKKYANEYENK